MWTTITSFPEGLARSPRPALRFAIVPIWASQVTLVVKDLPASAGDQGDAGSSPRWGGSPGGRHGNPLQYSCLENPTDWGAWWATVTGSQRVRQDWATSLSLYEYQEKKLNPNPQSLAMGQIVTMHSWYGSWRITHLWNHNLNLIMRK